MPNLQIPLASSTLIELGLSAGEFSIDQGWETIRRVEFLSTRMEATVSLGNIAARQGRIDFVAFLVKEVKSILATGHSNDEIDIALLALSRLLALTHDFSQGEAAVDSMENPYQQSEALVSLMNEAARVQDLARAQHFMHRTEALAYRAIDYAGRAHILAILALGVNDLGWSDTARRFADRIDDGYLRAHLLVKLAANGNLHDRRRFLAAALRYGTLEISLPLIADTDPTILDTLTDEFDKASPKPLI